MKIVDNFKKTLGLGTSMTTQQQGSHSVGPPLGTYMKGEKNVFFAGFRPHLRSTQDDISEAWEPAAARAVDHLHNSGFLFGAVKTKTSAVVGHGLRCSVRPDHETLGWDLKFSRNWSRKVEAKFRAWSENKFECDAGGKLTFGQMQQVTFGSFLVFGEWLALFPLVDRSSTQTMSKVSVIPPTRIVNESDYSQNLVQGVKTDKWGFPVSYKMCDREKDIESREVWIKAFDKDGRPNIGHGFEPSMAANRGISRIAHVLKALQQVDQVFDSTIVKYIVQTMFAAVLTTNMSGAAAFEGLKTTGDHGTLDLNEFVGAADEWYKAADINLKEHGRIAHLMPNQELDFKESTTQTADLDRIMGWLMREIAMGIGISYDAVSGDTRGATYSSIRMDSAREWLKVIQDRKNIVVPFCRTVFLNWLEEQIGKGEIEFEGGLDKFIKSKDAIATKWSGPPKPQADDFKTARAFQVRKDMGATTMEEIYEEYGRDWDDDFYQRAAENELADELGLPLPWAPVDPLETKKGQEAEIESAGNAAQTPPKNKKRKGAGRLPGDNPDRTKSQEDINLGDDLNASLEAELVHDEDGGEANPYTGDIKNGD